MFICAHCNNEVDPYRDAYVRRAGNGYLRYWHNEATGEKACWSKVANAYPVLSGSFFYRVIIIYMKNLSMTGLGILGYLISSALAHFNVFFTESEVGVFVNSAVQVVTFIMAIYGQVTRKDLVGGLVRR